jgi:hypothetical protein
MINELPAGRAGQGRGRELSRRKAKGDVHVTSVGAKGDVHVMFQND